MQSIDQNKGRDLRWITLVALLGLSAVVYVSIIYKIIKFGP